MAKINREKIVKAAVGSARLEGYKGSLRVVSEKRSSSVRSAARPKTTAKLGPRSSGTL
ncbi:MAG: hypothetical protein M3416_00525 [Acidobacteriota bacterium]|nr:hypothetical protein [Acidobacteriota bacterium]